MITHSLSEESYCQNILLIGCAFSPRLGGDGEGNRYTFSLITVHYKVASSDRATGMPWCIQHIIYEHIRSCVLAAASLVHYNWDYDCRKSS